METVIAMVVLLSVLCVVIAASVGYKRGSRDGKMEGFEFAYDSWEEYIDTLEERLELAGQRAEELSKFSDALWNRAKKDSITINVLWTQLQQSQQNSDKALALLNRMADHCKRFMAAAVAAAQESKELEEENDALSEENDALCVEAIAASNELNNAKTIINDLLSQKAPKWKIELAKIVAQ